MPASAAAECPPKTLGGVTAPSFLDRASQDHTPVKTVKNMKEDATALVEELQMEELKMEALVEELHSRGLDVAHPLRLDWCAPACAPAANGGAL